MAKFSERYGYTKVSDVIIREEMTTAILNSISNWFYALEHRCAIDFKELERNVWIHHLREKESEYHVTNGYRRGFIVVINPYLSRKERKWYEILNLVEYVCEYLRSISFYGYDECIANLNDEFKKLNYAYQIIDCQIVEITSDQEIRAIEVALRNPLNGVRAHLKTALDRMSPTQETPDYRNSIKESISAVEMWCRNATGKATLGDALKRLEANGVIIPVLLKSAFIKLYVYTNDKQTGIRHALMDDEYVPTADEAIFMLVSCSAFINYLTKKNNQ